MWAEYIIKNKENKIMSTTKQARSPSEGIYYVVPGKDGHAIVLSQREDEIENATHMFFWEKILKSIAHEYSLKPDQIEDLKTNYMAIPRGRVVKDFDHQTFKYTGKYIVLHGGDVPVTQIRNLVEQDFGLIQLSSQKKVLWKVDDHEKMDSKDRKIFLEVIKKQ